MTGSVLEIVEFKSSADVEQVQKAANLLESWLRNQAGFKWRRLSLRDDGIFVDCIEWDDMNSAKIAAETIMTEPSARAFMELIDGPSVVMHHATIVLSI